MDLIAIFFIFIVGLSIGSFLNVCIYRIPREESIVFPPSHCTNCNSKLKPKDLVPVFSYIFLKGKCRYCGEKIKITYVIIELMTAVASVGIYVKYGFSGYFFIYSFLISLLIVIAKIDLDTFTIYLSTSIVGLIGGIVAIIYNLYKGQGLFNVMLSILIPLIIIGLLILITKGMGTGDLETYLVVSLYFPAKMMGFILFLSIVIAGIHGLIKIALGKGKMKTKMAFVPYIGVATFVAIMWGQWIVNSYLALIGF